MEISWEDFQKVDLRVGTIVSAARLENARNPAYKLEIDLGPELKIKKSSAQITELYSAEGLVGKKVLCVVNFPKKQIGTFMSEVLVTGVPNKEGSVVLVNPDSSVDNGVRLF